MIIISIVSLIMMLKINTIPDEYVKENVKEQKISRVKNNNLFYTIENCLQKYETYLTLNYEQQVDELNMPSIAAIYNISSKEEKTEAWDELEKSVIASAADDVIVGVKGRKADIIIVKKFA